MVRPWKFKGCQNEPLCSDGNLKAPASSLRTD
jgi:hypothetical protein